MPDESGRVPRYAPPNADGEKPYVVTISSWGKRHDVIVYADKPGNAVYRAIGRAQHTSGKARRATPADMEGQP